MALASGLTVTPPAVLVVIIIVDRRSRSQVQLLPAWVRISGALRKRSAVSADLVNVAESLMVSSVRVRKVTVVTVVLAMAW